ncbi:MAG: 16S rRNA (guanine(966)-N(2))-methyltransferase RsmD [Longimicrobiales bacterium]
MRIIAGEWGGRRLSVVPGKKVRPTSDRVREAWMSILQAQLDGARVLDLFAGSGALGLEALSRGAAHCTFVERSRTVVRVLTKNVEQLDAGSRARVHTGDGIAFAERLTTSPASDPAVATPFDIALADPPYGRGFGRALVDLFWQRPFASSLWVEHRRDEEVISDGWADSAAEAQPFGDPRFKIDRRSYGDTALTGIFHDPGGLRSTKTSLQ